MELSDWIPVVHSIECSNLIHTHWWHLQHPCNLVHDAQAAESMLPLSEVQKGHHSGLLVLGRVSLEDLIDELVVLFGELEGDTGIVHWGISVL